MTKDERIDALDAEAERLGGQARLQCIVGADDPARPWRCFIESPRVRVEAWGETLEDAARQAVEVCKEIRHYV